MGLTFEDIMNYCKTNKIIFNEIKDNLNSIVPFVGAGLSAFAYPLWKKALEDLTAFINNKNTREEIKALIDKGLLEDAAQEIEDKRGKHNLANDLLSVFSANKLEEEINSLYKQSVYLLPYIFKGAVITTNYDLIIENVYRQVLNDLNMPVLLPGKPELINQYLGQKNRPVIYKVHGEIQKKAIDYSSIIFTKKQYDEKYTKDSQLVKELKKHDLHLAIETTGYVQPNIFKELAPMFDLILFDIKHYDSYQHFLGTNVHNELIIQNLKWAVKQKIEILPRIPVIPDFNASLDDAKGIAKLLTEVQLSKVQLLPFHQFGEKKYELLNREYRFKNKKALYPEDLQEYQQIFLDKGIDCFF